MKVNKTRTFGNGIYLHIRLGLIYLLTIQISVEAHEQLTYEYIFRRAGKKPEHSSTELTQKHLIFFTSPPVDGVDSASASTEANEHFSSFLFDKSIIWETVRRNRDT